MLKRTVLFVVYSPFFLKHPSTGNVCIPLDPSTIDHFQLSSVPKLSAIMSQVIFFAGILFIVLKRLLLQLDAGVPTCMEGCLNDFRRLFLDPLEAANRQERLLAKQQKTSYDF